MVVISTVEGTRALQSANFAHDLLAEVLAVQQSQKRFRHTLDPIEYILFEMNFSPSPNLWTMTLYSRRRDQN